jgi:hypothetical protein
VVVGVAAGAGYLVAGARGSGTKGPSVGQSTSTTTTQITKGTLSARTMENGTLGYAGDYSVINKSSGTLTKVPAAGQIFRQGETLYKVDNKAVVFLEGDYVPVYRDLSVGTKGVDVQQLNADLVALGYASSSDLDPTSTYFSWGTYYALEKLQHHVGLTKTGKLTQGQAVFVPFKQIRITKAGVNVGASVPSGGVVLNASSASRQVVVSLAADRQSQVKARDKVTITLPNGKTTDGAVSEVGKVATKGSDSTTVSVYITPADPKATGDLDQAPVKVSIVTDTVKDVLAVPVNALLALAGGGYAVEVVDPGGKHRLVSVTTGLFDDSAGTVQITGNGLTAGQNVVVPAT